MIHKIANIINVLRSVEVFRNSSLYITLIKDTL